MVPEPEIVVLLVSAGPVPSPVMAALFSVRVPDAAQRDGFLDVECAVYRDRAGVAVGGGAGQVSGSLRSPPSPCPSWRVCPHWPYPTCRCSRR